MTLLKVCPNCYRSYPDITQNYCTDDGTSLSEPFPIPVKNEEPEEETVIRQPKVVRVARTKSVPPAVAGGAVFSRLSAKPQRDRTNAKDFIARNFPELSKYKRRSSRMWESSEKPIYRDNWWFGLMVSDLDQHEYIVFAGALDHANRNFKLLKVPTSYLRQNLSKVDVTDDGWINLYIHMSDLVDIRNNAGLSFRQFTVN